MNRSSRLPLLMGSAFAALAIASMMEPTSTFNGSPRRPVRIRVIRRSEVNMEKVAHVAGIRTEFDALRLTKAEAKRKRRNEKRRAVL